MELGDIPRNASGRSCTTRGDDFSEKMVGETRLRRGGGAIGKEEDVEAGRRRCRAGSSDLEATDLILLCLFWNEEQRTRGLSMLAYHPIIRG